MPRPFDPVELLAFHADALRQGHDLTEVMTQTYGTYWPELPPLLQLAQKLYQQLSPQVEPSPSEGYVPDGWSAASKQAMIVALMETGWLSNRRGLLLLGSALSMVGLSLCWLGFRRFWPIDSVAADPVAD